MVFAGALQAFEEAEYEQGRLMGTSAGSITAVLLAAVTWLTTFCRH